MISKAQRFPLPFFRITPRGRVTFANDAAVRLFGFSDGAELASSPLKALCPDKATRRRLVDLLEKDGQLNGIEAEFQHLSGRRLRIQVYAQPVLDPRSSVVHFEGALVDVTSQQLAIAELEDTQRRLRSFFDRSPVAYWIEDFSALGAWLDRLRADGLTDVRAHLDENPHELRYALDLIRIVDVNPAALALVGAPNKEAVLDRGLSAVVDDVALGSFREQVIAVWEGRPSLRSVASGRKLSGEEFEYILTWVATLNNGPHLGSVIVSIEDITELNEASRRLAAMAEMKDRFIESVTHELRTPLTGVFGFAGVLRERWQEIDEQEAGEYLDLLWAEAATAADTLENLVIVDELTAEPDSFRDRALLEPADVDLGTLARDAIASLSPERRKRVSIADGTVAARGDSRRVGLIARNLVNNAIRHGGDDVLVTVVETRDVACLVVADDGDGIPVEILDRAFEPYEGRQPHPGLTDSLGLGLAVSRALARAMGGELRYEQVNGSTVFTLELPSATRPTR